MVKKTKKKVTKKTTPKYQSTSQLAIAGFVFTFVFFPLGLVFSILALKQIKKTGQSGRGLALAGCIISALFLVFTVWLVLATVVQISDVAKRVNSPQNTHTAGSLANDFELESFDATSQTDINGLSLDLDYYHKTAGGYPSFADINSSEWRKSSGIPDFVSGTHFCSPSATSSSNCTLSKVPAKGTYSYQPLEADGITPCNAGVGQMCSKYTLTTILQSESYTRMNHGSTSYTKQNQP
jgi:hypothetical protein